MDFGELKTCFPAPMRFVSMKDLQEKGVLGWWKRLDREIETDIARRQKAWYCRECQKILSVFEAK